MDNRGWMKWKRRSGMGDVGWRKEKGGSGKEEVGWVM